MSQDTYSQVQYMFNTLAVVVYMYAVLIVNIIVFRIFFNWCLLNFSITCRNPKTPAYSSFKEVPSF